MNKEIMLKCTRVNRDYMRLPAVKVAGSLFLRLYL